MRKIASLIFILLIAINGNAGETKVMEAFDRKTLEIEDNWSAKENLKKTPIIKTAKKALMD